MLNFTNKKIKINKNLPLQLHTHIENETRIRKCYHLQKMEIEIYSSCDGFSALFKSQHQDIQVKKKKKKKEKKKKLPFCGRPT